MFRHAPGNRTAREGAAIQMHCISIADPRTIYSKLSDWKKDGKSLPDSGSRITISMGRLTINNARTSDSGNYSCTLVNTAGSSTSSAIVLVEGNCKASLSLFTNRRWRGQFNVSAILDLIFFTRKLELIQ